MGFGNVTYIRHKINIPIYWRVCSRNISCLQGRYASNSLNCITDASRDSWNTVFFQLIIQFSVKAVSPQGMVFTNDVSQVSVHVALWTQVVQSFNNVIQQHCLTLTHFFANTWVLNVNNMNMEMVERRVVMDKYSQLIGANGVIEARWHDCPQCCIQLLQPFLMRGVQVSQRLDVLPVDYCHQVQCVQVDTVPFHIWEDQEPVLIVRIQMLVDNPVVLGTVVQDIVHPLHHLARSHLLDVRYDVFLVHLGGLPDHMQLLLVVTPDVDICRRVYQIQLRRGILLQVLLDDRQTPVVDIIRADLLHTFNTRQAGVLVLPVVENGRAPPVRRGPPDRLLKHEMRLLTGQNRILPANLPKQRDLLRLRIAVKHTLKPKLVNQLRQILRPSIGNPLLLLNLNRGNAPGLLPKYLVLVNLRRARWCIHSCRHLVISLTSSRPNKYHPDSFPPPHQKPPPLYTLPPKRFTPFSRFPLIPLRTNKLNYKNPLGNLRCTAVS